jgi:hypothetical protein
MAKKKKTTEEQPKAKEQKTKRELQAMARERLGCAVDALPILGLGADPARRGAKERPDRSDQEIRQPHASFP